MINVDMIKICKHCSKEKTFDEFAKRPSRKIGYQSWCRKCMNEYKKRIPKYKETRREYDKKNRKKIQMSDRKRNRKRILEKFGISEQVYDELLIAQDGKCAICKNDETAVDNRYGLKKRLAVDHNHITGKIRGLLCTKCNSALGFLKEDINIIISMLKYIEEYA